MTSTALVSGGKDSIYSAYLAETQGWVIDELLTIAPEDPDSMLFHTPNLRWVALQAKAWGKFHRAVSANGSGEDAESEALERALSGSKGLVVAGAIQSSYQWARLHRVCYWLGRRLFTPLWGKEPGTVVRAEIESGLDIRLVHLAAESLDPRLIGQRLDGTLLKELERRSREIRRLNVAGEGGEFETLVVDAPFFRKRLVIDEEEVSERGSTTRLTIRRAHLEDKGVLDATVREGGSYPLSGSR
ncbi:MAG: diphthine--ammonia ligase [Thermoplasmata archaeon]